MSCTFDTIEYEHARTHAHTLRTFQAHAFNHHQINKLNEMSLW